jgi:hypothetical protein
MAMLYALTVSFDAAGSNVLFPAVPAGSITGEDLPAAKRLAPAIGFAERPLGPTRWNHVSPQDFYRAVLEDTPIPSAGSSGSAPICSLLTAILFAVVPHWSRSTFTPTLICS